MWFKLLGEISDGEVIAAGKTIRGLRRLEKAYGLGRWRKLKGTAVVELPNGKVVRAEVH